jgi:importin subunit alpha-1
MPPLLQNLGDSQNLSILRIATWTLSLLCHGTPQPKWDIVSISLPVLARVIYSTDDEVLTDACWALSCLSDNNSTRQQVIDSHVFRRLVTLLTVCDSFAVLTAALCTIGNIVTDNDTQQVVLRMLSESTKITTESALVTMFESATSDQLRHLIDRGMVNSMCNLLEFPDPMIIVVALEGLENMLRIGSGNEVATQIKEHGGVQKLEALQYHRANNIYGKSLKILEIIRS